MATEGRRAPVIDAEGRSEPPGPVLARSWPSVVAGVTAIGIVVALAWDVGGYFAPGYLGAGVIAFAVLGALLVLRPPHWSFSTQALVALGALATLVVWTALSSRWSPAPDTALEETQRTLVYVGLFALALIAAGSGRLARFLVLGVAAAVMVVVGAGLLSRLYPDVLGAPASLVSIGGYRLAYPLNYWNAYGALASLATVLTVGIASDPRSAVPIRAIAAGAAVIAAVAMYLSFSRGAWLALIVGVVALLALGAHRGSLLVTGGIVGLASALAVGRLDTYPALTDNPRLDGGQLEAGHAYAPQLLTIVGIVLVVQALLAAGRASPAVMKLVDAVTRPVVRGTAIGLGVAFVAIYAVGAAKVEGRTAAWTEDATSWVDRQWAEFLRPGTFAAQDNTARLTTARGTRSDLYRVAIDGFEHRPLWGDGAGGFEVRFMRARRVDETVRNAHSLYLETLGQLGLVGALLLLAFIASIVAAAIRSRVRPGGLGRSQTAAVGGACAVWIAHSMVDWDWQMPALTGAALILAATLFPYGRRSSERGPE